MIEKLQFTTLLNESVAVHVDTTVPMLNMPELTLQLDDTSDPPLNVTLAVAGRVTDAVEILMPALTTIFDGHVITGSDVD